LLPAPCTKIAESSPRSILDWQTLDFAQDDCEFEDYDEVSFKATLSELATKAGVNWENDDGWVEVRGLSTVVEAGTSSEYSDLGKGKEGISAPLAGVNWEGESDGDCDYDTWMKMDGDDEISDGDRCRVGSCDCEQSGEVDSCGEVMREKSATAVFLGFSFFSFLFYYYYYFILVQILQLIKSTTLAGPITMLESFLIPFYALHILKL